LLVGIPGHYKANKSVSFLQLRGFRNVRLAGGGEEDEDDEDEEEEEEEEGRAYMAGRHKREWLPWLVAVRAGHPGCWQGVLP